MKPEEFRLEMIVRVKDDAKDSDFTPGEKLLTKGIIYFEGNYFILVQAWNKEKKNLGPNINISEVEVVKTEMEEQMEKIKKEIQS
jgi:hypothetical protein